MRRKPMPMRSAGNANPVPITAAEINARYLRDKIADFESTVEAAARDLCTSVFVNVHDRLMGSLDGLGGRCAGVVEVAAPVFDQIASVVDTTAPKHKRSKPGKPGKLSPEARERIVAAQRKRWAKVRREKKLAEAGAKRVKGNGKVAKPRTAARKATKATKATKPARTRTVAPAETNASASQE